ncbi:unnamed protein product [Amoebophrya sp. A25]|nr:unnamed protein product [Amoebophrya sp. A25]|eukprot:GSA25T00001851001.1
MTMRRGLFVCVATSCALAGFWGAWLLYGGAPVPTAGGVGMANAERSSSLSVESKIAALDAEFEAIRKRVVDRDFEATTVVLDGDLSLRVHIMVKLRKAQIQFGMSPVSLRAVPEALVARYTATSERGGARTTPSAVATTSGTGEKAPSGGSAATTKGSSVSNFLDFPGPGLAWELVSNLPPGATAKGTGEDEKRLAQVGGAKNSRALASTSKKMLLFDIKQTNLLHYDEPELLRRFDFVRANEECDAVLAASGTAVISARSFPSRTRVCVDAADFIFRSTDLAGDGGAAEIDAAQTAGGAEDRKTESPIDEKSRELRMAAAAELVARLENARISKPLSVKSLTNSEDLLIKYKAQAGAASPSPPIIFVAGFKPEDEAESALITDWVLDTPSDIIFGSPGAKNAAANVKYVVILCVVLWLSGVLYRCYYLKEDLEKTSFRSSRERIASRVCYYLCGCGLRSCLSTVSAICCQRGSKSGLSAFFRGESGTGRDPHFFGESSEEQRAMVGTPARDRVVDDDHLLDSNEGSSGDDDDVIAHAVSTGAHSSGASPSQSSSWKDPRNSRPKSVFGVELGASTRDFSEVTSSSPAAPESVSDGVFPLEESGTRTTGSSSSSRSPRKNLQDDHLISGSSKNKFQMMAARSPEGDERHYDRNSSYALQQHAASASIAAKRGSRWRSVALAFLAILAFFGSANAGYYLLYRQVDLLPYKVHWGAKDAFRYMCGVEGLKSFSTSKLSSINPLKTFCTDEASRAFQRWEDIFIYKAGLIFLWLFGVERLFVWLLYSNS